MCGMIDYYQNHFAALPVQKDENLWPQETAGREPYVPFLLLSLLDLIERKKITSRFVEISEGLVAQFTKYCICYDAGAEAQSHFIRAFYQLEQFDVWSISFRMGQNKKDNSDHEASSIAKLKELVYGSKIPEDLLPLLVMATSRNKIYTTILTTYFSDEFSAFLIKKCSM